MEAENMSIAKNDSSDVVAVTDDFPPFVPDVMNYAGDVDTKRESFRENRTAIYRRNQLLAVKQQFELKQVKDDKITVRLPEREKSKVSRGEKTVYRVKPAQTPAPVQQKPASGKKRVNTYAAIMLGFAVFLAVFVTAVALTDSSSRSNSAASWAKNGIVTEEKRDEPVIDHSEPVEKYIEKDGFTMAVIKQKYTFGAYSYDYVFEFTNTSNSTVTTFPNIFAYADGTENISDMLVFHSGGAKRYTWTGGVPSNGSPVVLKIHGKYVLSENVEYNIQPGESVIGAINFALL